MIQEKLITGQTTEEVWEQINTDFATLDSLNDYHIVIEQAGRHITLDIDIDFGGGFEGGYEITALTAPLPPTSFRFAIHPQDFLYEIGKLFGVQDVAIGYPEFDKNVIVKTNDEVKVRQLFADPDTREIFQSLSGYSLSITEDENDKVLLELNIQRGIIDADELLPLYTAFYNILNSLD
jgi:hypothetical protein